METNDHMTNEEFCEIMRFPTMTEEQEEVPVQEEEVDEELLAMNEDVRQGLKDNIMERKYIVSFDILESTINRLRCTECGRSTDITTVEHKEVCAGISFSYSCTNGHPQRWTSTQYFGSRSIMGQILALTVLLSGLTYHHFAQAANFIKLSVPCASYFFLYQDMFSRGIITFFDQHIRSLTPGLVAAVDTRYDSPGFCASKSTTVAMDYNTSTIAAVVFGDKRCVKSSGAMETQNTQNLLSTLHKQGVREVVTDASSTIKKIMAEPENEDKYIHSMDVWHKGKRIAEMIKQEIKGKKELRVLNDWIKPIVKHFWWCSKQCGGNMMEFDDLWTGLFYHCQNIHSWSLGSCHHTDVDYVMKEPVIAEGTAAFEAIRSHGPCPRRHLRCGRKGCGQNQTRHKQGTGQTRKEEKSTPRSG